MESDEEILRRLLAMDASGVRRLPPPSKVIEVAESLGISIKTGWPEVILRFKAGGEGKPVLRGRLVDIAAKEFVLLDERTGACWGVSRMKWDPIRAQDESRRCRENDSAEGEVDPATDIFRKERVKAEAEKRQLQRPRRKRKRPLRQSRGQREGSFESYRN